MNTVVSYPGALTHIEREAIADRVREWGQDRSQPLVLDDGLELASIEGRSWWADVAYFAAGAIAGIAGVFVGAVLL